MRSVDDLNHRMVGLKRSVGRIPLGGRSRHQLPRPDERLPGRFGLAAEQSSGKEQEGSKSGFHAESYENQALNHIIQADS